MLTETFTAAWQYIAAHPDRFNDALSAHVFLSLSAISIAFVIGFPLGILLAYNPKASQWVSGFFSGLRVIPSLAVLALMIPILGTGFKPALLALVLLAIPSLLINTSQGLSQVSPAISEAAHGLGMDGSQIFWRISLPLAWPAILTGLRMASVEVLSSATLAALIGGGGLGLFIINGLGMYQFGLLLVGAIPVVLLVLLTDTALGLLIRFSRQFTHTPASEGLAT